MVPAQSFCAPVRARLIAAARLIPSVCGVLGSSSPPGITRTPSRRQSGRFALSLTIEKHFLVARLEP